VYETLAVERAAHLTTLTLNRPDALNALSRKMVDELRDFFWKLVDDSDTRVVLLRGAGRAFCAGLDLKEAGSDASGGATRGGIPASLRAQRHIAELMMLMRRAPQPIIAAVQGAATGGGFALALASDVRIAGESARMNAAFIRLGLSACDVGVSYFLPRIVGASVASELLLTGDFIHADRALATGLVSRVVPDAELDATCLATAHEIAKLPAFTVKMFRRTLGRLANPPVQRSIEEEAVTQSMVFASRDYAEMKAARAEKRDPKYRGR